MVKYYWDTNDNKEKTLEEIKVSLNASIPDDPDLEFVGIYEIRNTPEPSYDPLREFLQWQIKNTREFGKDVYYREWEVFPLPAGQVQENLQKQSGIIKESCKNKVKELLNETAKQYDYDDIISACSYTNSTVQAYKEEAERFVKFRDDVWELYYSIMNEGVPETTEGFLEQFPKYEDYE